MARLYADEDFDHPVVLALRSLGHDVVTAQEAGQAQQGIAVSAFLVVAGAQGGAFLTYNRRHFIHLHRLSTPHLGIIVCTRDDDSIALADRIHQAVTTLASLDNQLVRITRPPPRP